MFDSNSTTFPLAGEYKSMGSRIFKFIGPDDRLYNAYFTPTKGFIEVLFDCKESPGFDRLIADGYMTEKVNTVADLMLQYEAEYGNQMKAFGTRLLDRGFCSTRSTLNRTLISLIPSNTTLISGLKTKNTDMLSYLESLILTLMKLLSGS